MAPKPMELNTLAEFDDFFAAQVRPLLQDIASQQAALQQQQLDDKRKSELYVVQVSESDSDILL